ncbi:flagellin [Rummeliibacillus sp. POC4]|uniref:flagellin n=1 Tax=Rummeliibacillus sp. POC4 TaxID=2305899 RepID=UPI000E66DA1A|nr:flagellin [Rummeliibacillus sp. POC4]RIJ69387.1 VWA domain-containing protein [Rummeliibacillus sp. POC4]
MQIRFNKGQFTLNRYVQTNSEINKTLKKLSSGYRINDAADDAAGLSISEKMRAQINGLNQASENIQDGISLINVADGGLGQIQSPNLVRMRELIIQAANDTNTIEDRQKIQQEIDQIKQGINDIAESSEFNTIPVLTPTDLKPVPNATPKFDIIFLIDDSGSMGQSIKMVKAGLSTFSEKMKTWGDVAFGSTSVATPFTNGTRDLNLTSDIKVLENHLENVHQATGGTTQTEKILSNLLDSTSALGGRPDA